MKAGVVLIGLYTKDVAWKLKQIWSKSNRNISVVKNTCAYMNLPYLYCIEIFKLYRTVENSATLFCVCVPMKTLPWQWFPPEGLLSLLTNTDSFQNCNFSCLHL